MLTKLINDLLDLSKIDNLNFKKNEYYFKLIQAMYFVPGTPAIGELDKSYTYKLAVIAILILVLGVFPNLLFNYLYF